MRQETIESKGFFGVFVVRQLVWEFWIRAKVSLSYRLMSITSISSRTIRLILTHVHDMNLTDYKETKVPL